MTVNVHPEALAADNVGIGEIVGALSAQNLAAPVGRVIGSLDERSIRLKGRLQTPDEFKQLIVAERGGFIPEGIEFDTANRRFLTGSLVEGTIFEIGNDGTMTPAVLDPSTIAAAPWPAPGSSRSHPQATRRSSTLMRAGRGDLLSLK